MRFEHEGMSLWYGLPDTPAPEGAIHVGSDITVTIAVKPADASNEVELLYRRDQGTVETVPAKWLRHDLSLNAQYFKARFPVFRVGDTVEYTAVCYCAGRQVPSHSEAQQLASSFHVTGVEIKPAPGLALKETPVSSNASTTDFSARETLLMNAGNLQTTPPRAQSRSGDDDSNQQFVVQGHIRYPDGRSVEPRPVRVFNVELRRLQTLGEGVTNADGGYQIAYSARQWLEKGQRPSLMIRVLNAQGEIEGTSPTRFNVGQLETIDLEISPADYRPPSEYERLLSSVSPNLQGLRMADLNERDMHVLAGVLETQPEQVQRLIQAHRSAQELGVAPEVLYGLFQQNQSTNVTALLAQWPEFQRSALQKAINAGIISQELSEQLDALVEQLQQAYVRQVLKTSPSAQDGSLSALLNLAGLQTPEQQERFATLYAAHQGSDSAFWQELSQQPEFSDPHLVASLRTTLTLDELVQNHLALLTALLSAGGISTPCDLVLLSEDDWVALILGKQGERATGPAADDREKAHTYAREIIARVEAAYPTAAVAHHIAQEGLPGKEDLVHFFANNPDFELGTTSIDRYVQQRREQALAGVQDRQQLMANLKGIQRVFKLVPRYSQMRPLLVDGLTSAQRIASLNKDTFIADYADKLGGASEAAAIYHRADYIAAHALALHTKYSFDYNAITTNVIPTLPSEVDSIPNWSTLFGSPDFCDCQECRSVLSPAAYFVDILQFLKHNAQYIATEAGGSRTGKDVLFDAAQVQRANPVPFGGWPTGKTVLFDHRPDLGTLELSCENTNIPLPYIDLVNELLENLVAPPPPGTPAPQTHNSAAELLAHPEYVNDAAYAQLAKQVYPWSFPFNLGTQEARIYLNQAGLSRYQFLETFYPFSSPVETTGFTVLQDVRIAAEYLGLTPGEWDLLTGAALQSAAVCWGYGTTPPTDWITQLSQIQTLLDRSGLQYEDLLRLLDSAYINPLERQIPVPSPATDYPQLHLVVGSSQCDLTQMTVQNLNEAVLQRIHRFVRLWRRLGWDLFDLDKVITALRLGDTTTPFSLTPDFLVQVAHLQRLHTDHKVPVLTVLSWWTRIDTTEHQGENLVPSLYDQVYQNRVTLTNKADRDLFALGALGTGQLLQDHLSPLRAVLGLGIKDLQTLLATLSDSTITLETLSQLYRSVTLARALKLSIKEFLSIKKLTQIDPFAAVHAPQPFQKNLTAQTLWFIQKVKTIQASAFHMADLDALLLNPADQVFTPATATTATAARLLTDLRSALAKVSATSVTTSTQNDDPTTLAVLDAADASNPSTLGNLSYQRLLDLLKNGQVQVGTQTHQLLPLILNTSLVQQVISILDGTAAWSTPLASLPASVTLPADINIAYNSSTQQLQFTGNMTWDEKMHLRQLSSDPTYGKALDSLFNQSRLFIESNMVGFLDLTAAGTQLFSTNGAVSVPLAALPPGVTLPAGMKISYNSTDKLVAFVGSMTDSEKGQLLGLSTDTNYQNAIKSLYSQQALARAVRYGYSYKRLNTYLYASSQILAQKLGEPLKITADNMTALVQQLKLVPADPTQPPLLAILLNPDFLASVGALRAPQWSAQFQAVALLQSCALIIAKFNIITSEVNWLLQHAAALGWLDLNTLPPVGPAPAHSLFVGWERLVGVFSLRDTYPALRDTMPIGNTALFNIFATALNFAASPHTPAETAAAAEAMRQELNQRLGWLETDMLALEDPIRLNFSFPTAYEDERVLLRLKDCFAILKRLQISAAQAWSWTVPAQQWNWAAPDAMPEINVGDDIEKAVKATYTNEQWLAIAGPLRDQLRQPQRDALVAYLIVHPERLFEPAQKPDDLFAQLYIDVEMNACQLTSRIKQAISSAQLFVQRCLMGLEKNVAISQKGASEWNTWMKHYRIWEANRKVFLYPENWIEPELRDDKSSFFKDLENDLLQNEITHDSAENAFLHYLEKLDGVARLEVCGMYHQVEWQGQPYDIPYVVPEDIAKQGVIDVDILHVFARTTDTTPHIYYYRQRINGRTWTPWEKVDLDIEGNHLVPVVYERRLHIFWPTFSKKQPDPRAAIPSDPNVRPTIPSTQLEMKIAWSEYRNSKWSAKKVSKESIEVDLEDTDEAKSHLIFRAMVLDDLPIIFCYSSLINVDIFNCYVGYFAFTGCHGKILTGDFRYISIRYGNKFPFDLAWINTLVTLDPTKWQDLGNQAQSLPAFSSLLPMQLTELGVIFTIVMLSPTSLPRTTIENMMFKEQDDDPNPGDILFPSLQTTPGVYRVLYPEQSNQRVLATELYLLSLFGDPSAYSSFSLPLELLEMFFFQDGSHTYFVTSRVPGIVITSRNRRLQYLDRTSLYRLAANLPAHQLIAATALLTEATSTPTTRAAAPISNSQAMADARAASVKMIAPAPAALIPFYRFETFYHPYVCTLIKVLNRYGIDGLLNPDPSSFVRRQLASLDYFYGVYGPDSQVDTAYPLDDFDFSPNGAYSIYNWELFFHAPLLIACRLMQNQKFAEAQKWFHYIFDPTVGHETLTKPLAIASQRYWKVRPFYQNNDVLMQIDALLAMLSVPGADPQKKQDLENQLDDWRQNPFQPHRIARVRITPYQKTVIMKYLDNLIAWGDQLFSQDTIEAINEATQIYILAADILGPRPVNVPPQERVGNKTYNDLERTLDDFSNALIEAEEFIEFPYQGSVPSPFPLQTIQMVAPKIFYFCIPKNDKLLGYWGTVADRLFKVRNCMNIQGVVRQLPLFEPPIDPALLVLAAAAGIDLGSVLNSLNVALSPYRFTVLIQKALELCNEVRSLGAALLSAMEKRDAEGLALLRSSLEIQLMDSVQKVKEAQVNEAQYSLQAVQKSQDTVNDRQKYYASRPYTNPQEQLHALKLDSAMNWQTNGQISEVAAAVVHIIPILDLGSSGWAATPVVKALFGGANVGNALQATGRAMGLLAQIDTHAATMAQIEGGNLRRQDDWTFQASQASDELAQLDKQITAATIRLTVAEQELQNHIQQKENEHAIDDYMHTKFTNQDLYDWMVSQISAIYFQCYRMAYDVAKKAERSFQYELGAYDASFIQPTYWNSLKKGLLVGEQLYQDLKHLEMAYYEQNRREYEITRHISLNMLDPMALTRLKETGDCHFRLPEVLFDLDYPGHYMRRIKTVGVTVPCVVGPYTNVNCTLTLTKNTVRVKSDPVGNEGNYKRVVNSADPRFLDNVGAIQSIVTSNAQNDSGLFEMNLRDERYNPFEGAGLIESQWRLQLPLSENRFDFSTIPDVILHIRYTARDGGETLKAAAQAARGDLLQAVQAQEQILVQAFSARRDFSSDWYRFLHPVDSQQDQMLALTLNRDHFPVWPGNTLQITHIGLLLKLTDSSVNTLSLSLTTPDGSKTDSITLNKIDVGDVLVGGQDYSTHVALDERSWQVILSQGQIAGLPAHLRHTVKVKGVAHESLNPDAVEDLGIICVYALTN